jgi:GNAT superfamily N-acetyltransferase
MLLLAEEVFDTRSDPAQLNVDPAVLEHLRQLHPATVSEEDDGNGPIAWVLLIPTTAELMKAFVTGTITEQELYDRTPVGAVYEAVYLCSGMVLEEHRRKGITKRLTLDALHRIRADHPIRALFVWTFSQEGRLSAEAIARASGLPLAARKAR